MAKEIQSRAEQALSTYRQIRESYRILAQLNTEMLAEIAEVVKTYRDTGVMLPIPDSNDRLVNRLKQDIDRLQQQLNHLRRNYIIARVLGKSWEDGLRNELALRQDTKLEIVYLAGKYIQVPKIGKLDFTLQSDVSPVANHVEIITMEFRQWVDPESRQCRFIAFSDELNVLYVRRNES